jgi:hypothetical protein
LIRANRGVVPCFGKVTGYVLVLVAAFSNQDFGLPYDCQGRRIGPIMTVPTVARCSSWETTC